MHLEIYVDDLHQAEVRLVGLGATRPLAQAQADPDLVVLTDPAGHPFCIFERSTTGS